MKNVLRNDEVLRYFNGDNSLISASVSAVRVFEIQEELTVELDVSLLYAKVHKNFTITFENVVEYAFYHTNEAYFYNIANLKFFKDQDMYYISIDPDETTNTRTGSDNDCILSKGIRANASGAKHYFFYLELALRQSDDASVYAYKNLSHIPTLKLIEIFGIDVNNDPELQDGYFLTEEKYTTHQEYISKNIGPINLEAFEYCLRLYATSDVRELRKLYKEDLME